MTPSKAGRVKIMIRLETLETLMLGAGIKSNAQLARRMNSGVTNTTVWKLRKDGYTVNAAIVAGMLHAFPDVRFEQLFTIADDDASVAA
jgi:hypothetical protein